MFENYIFDLLVNLTDGIERWAADADGVPEWLYDAYCTASTATGNPNHNPDASKMVNPVDHETIKNRTA